MSQIGHVQALEPQVSAAAISERLFNCGQGYQHLHLLIDRHTEYPLQEEIEALQSSQPAPENICWPLDDEIFKDDVERAPLLVRLQRSDAAHMALVEASIQLALEQSQQAQQRSVCAWLFTHAEPQRLQSALKKSLDASWPNGQRTYLRYFDPRVMPQLMRILDASQQSSLLGPVDSWCQLGRTGKWQAHSPHNAHSANSAPSDPKPQNNSPAVQRNIHRLYFNAAEAQAIDRIELVNLTAKQLQKHGLNADHTQDASIDSALQAAQKRSINGAQDAIAYAWRTIAYGAAFTGHPALAQSIKQAAASGLPLEVLLEDELQLNQAA